MMRKTLLIVFLMSAAATLMVAQKVATLDNVVRPFSLVVDNGRLYVVDNDIIRMFSLDDYKELKVIGKKGAGPGEFPFAPEVHPFPGQLFVNTWGKIVFFKPDGQYVGEKRLSFPVRYNEYPVLPLGKDGFLGTQSAMGKETVSMVIMDKDFKAQKEISSGIPNMLPAPPLPGQPKVEWRVIGHCWSYEVYKDKIFVADTAKGFHFSVFDHTGATLYQINLPHEKTEVTSEYKDMFMERAKGIPNWETNKNFYKLIFPEHFPAFACFKVADDKIYAYTYTKKDGKYLIVVLDLKGTVLGKAFVGYDLPDGTRFKNRFSIYKDHIYYVKEDPETEAWDLYRDKIR